MLVLLLQLLFLPLLEPLNLLQELGVDKVQVYRVHALLVVLHSLLFGAGTLLLLEEALELLSDFAAEIAFQEELESSEIVKASDSL